MKSFFKLAGLTTISLIFFLGTTVQGQVLWSSTGGSAWLTGGNWTGGAVPTSTQDAQFGANPTSGTTGVGINMGSTSPNGLQQVGAIEVTSARSSLNLLIGDSSTTVSGILQVNGATVNSVANTILRNAGAGTTALIITNAQGSTTSTSTMALSNNLANAIIDATSPITIYSIITGLGFTKIGAGTLTLTASNLYSGNTIISNGIFALNDGAYLNNSTLVLAGATLQRNSQGITVNRSTAYKSPLVVSNNSTIQTTTTSTRTIHFDAPFSGVAGTTLILTNTATPGINHFRLYANSINYAGNIIIASGAGGSAQLESYVTNNSTPGTEQIFTGLISGGGVFYKNVESPNPGGNTIFSNANNTYSGGTQIRAGFVGLGAANCLGSGIVTLGYDANYLGLYAVGAAQTLTNDITADMTIVNSTNLQIRGAQNLTLTGRLLIHTNLTQLTISNTATTTISGVVTNAGITSLGINKQGPGTLALSGANTFNGSVIIGNGTLALTGSGSVNNVTNLAVIGGATLDLSGLSSPLALSSSQTLGGVATNSATGTIVLSGTASLTLGATSPLVLAYTNGTPVMAVTNGTLTLASGNIATVTVANGGAGLPAGSYLLISTNTGGFVSGTAPASVTVNGDGIAGSSPSLVISNSQLYLFINPSVTVPSVPVANAASSTNVTGFTASWNSASGATGYALDVSTVNNFSSFVPGYNNLLVGAVTAFAVTNLSPNSIYYYQVRATNANGPSGNSATIAVTTLVAPFVWNAGSGNWSAPASWQYANVPGNGAATGFTGAGGNSTNDLSGLLLDSLTFSNGAGAYLISGNALVVSNGIVNNSAAGETISAPLTLGVAETFGAISGPLTFSGPITNAGNTLTVNAAASVTNSGVISGAGALVKTGAGTLLLSATNTFTGATTNSAGTLLLAGGAALATSPLTLANVAGVTLGLSDTETIASLAGGGATGGTIALGANSLYVTSGTTTNSGAITGTGKLIKTGTGTLSLANASAIGPSFTLRVEGGTLDLNRGASPLIGILGAGNIIELAGGTLQISGSVQANFGFAAEEIDVYSNSTIFFNRTGSSSPTSPTNSSPLIFRNSATLSFGYNATITSGTTLFDAATHTLQGNATFALGSYGITIQNPIGESGGSFGLTKTGAGQLNLNGINTYSGPTTNFQGTLAVNATSTFGNGSGTLVLAGGDILDANTRAPAPITNPVLLLTNATIYGNGTLTDGSFRYFPFSSGSITTLGGTLTIRNEGTSGTNEFRLRLSGGGFNFTQPIVIGSTSDSNSLTTSLQLYNDTNSPPQTFAGNISGIGNLVKSSPTNGTGGISILSGSNSYAGFTTVSDGLLLVNNTTGSGTGTNTVSVSAFGSIGGTGTISGVLTVAPTNTIAPGSLGIGTLTLGSAPNLAGISLMEINRNGGSPLADKIVLTSGTLNYGGTLTVTNVGATLTGGEVFTLFSAPAYAGSFSTTNLPALGAGLNWRLNQLPVNGTLIVNRAPSATAMTVTRVAGLSVKIALSDLATNWSDADGDAVVLSGINLVTTNGVTLSTNSTTILYPSSQNVSDQFTYTIGDGQGGTNVGLVNIVTVTNAIGQVTGLINPGGGPVTVSFAGIPTYSYDVQRSTNLTDWVTILTTNAPAAGLFNYTDNFTDLGGVPPASAYYRLGWTP